MTGLHILEGVCAKKLGTTYLIDLETKSGIWGFFWVYGCGDEGMEMEY